MFRVIDTGKPARFPESISSPDLGWNNCDFKTFIGAVNYALKWLGIYKPSRDTFKLGIKYDYSGFGDYVEIIKLENKRVNKNKMIKAKSNACAICGLSKEDHEHGYVPVFIMKPVGCKCPPGSWYENDDISEICDEYNIECEGDEDLCLTCEHVKACHE